LQEQKRKQSKTFVSQCKLVLKISQLSSGTNQYVLINWILCISGLWYSLHSHGLMLTISHMTKRQWQ